MLWVDDFVQTIILFMLIFILFALLLTVWIKLTKLKKNYLLMMNGTGVENLEQVIQALQEKVNGLQKISDKQQERLNQIGEHLKRMKCKMGFHRYNAFHERGSDLSFSLAILDEFQNGVVLTGIHSREETYVYAKPLEKGQSKYTLSPEELESINQAVRME